MDRTKNNRWSIHPNILTDESICSWVKRLSQEFNNSLAVVLNRKSKMRIRDYNKIDILPPEKLVNYLNQGTGVPIDVIYSHSIKSYNQNFIPKEGLVRQGVFNKNNIGPNLIRIQYFFCPKCLNQSTPYFRWFWILVCYNFCHIHKLLMVDICERCEKSVNFMLERYDIQYCQYCKFDLRKTVVQYIDILDSWYDPLIKIYWEIINKDIAIHHPKLLEL